MQVFGQDGSVGRCRQAGLAVVLTVMDAVDDVLELGVEVHHVLAGFQVGDILILQAVGVSGSAH